MNRFRGIVFVCLLAGAVKLSGAAPSVTLNKEAVLGGFRTTGNNWAKYDTVVRIKRKESGMQVIFHAFFGEKKGVAKAVIPSKESEQIFGGECVEIQFAPDPASGKYYHFAVNISGSSYTACKRDMSWDPAGFTVKVVRLDELWLADMFIPYAALDMTAPADGQSVKINLGRVRNDGTGAIREGSGWCGDINYHDPAQYGTLTFDRGRQQPEIVRINSGANSCEVTLNYGECADPQTLAIEVHDEKNGKMLGRTLCKGKTLSGKFLLAKQGELALKHISLRTVRVVDKNGKVVFERSGKFSGDFRQLLQLDRFRLTGKEKTVSGSTQLSGENLCRIMGDNGKIFWQGKVSGKFELPVDMLPEGRFLVRIYFGGNYAERVLIKRNLPENFNPVPQEGNWSIDGEVFKKNGTPVYLLGGSSTPKRFLLVKNAFTLASGCPEVFPGAMKNYAVHTGRRYRRVPDVNGYYYPEKSVVDKHLANMLKRSAKQSPGLCRMIYEAQIRSYFPKADGKYQEESSLDVAEKIYRTLRKKEFPHFLSLQIDRQERIADFARPCDVFEMTCAGGYYTEPLPRISESFKELRSIVRGKPVIHWLGVTIPNNSCRVAEELRAELYLSVLNGGAGAILHLGHGYLPQARKRLWCCISTAISEVNELFNIVRSGETLPLEAEKGFTAGLYRCKGVDYLVAVNLSSTGKTGRFVLPDKRVVKLYFASWEPRIIKITP